MGKVINSIFIFLSIILAIPAILIMVTWNTLPGEGLYPVKRTLEEIPRLIFGNAKFAATYEVQMTGRRFEEASALIKTNRTEGLYELSGSIDQAKTKVIQTQNVVAKKELIAKLETYQQTLNDQKEQIRQSSPTSENTTPTPVPTTTATVTVTPTPTPTPSIAISEHRTTPSPIPTRPLPTTTPPVVRQENTTSQTVKAIEETQKKIEETKKELEKDLLEDQDKKEEPKSREEKKPEDKKGNKSKKD